jgi:predicted extracellular nuclease
VSFTSTGDCRGLTVADYNAENLAPNSTHLPSVVDQIINKLRTPDLIFLQEVQDNSGPTNDGVTSANMTLSALTRGLEQKSGVKYDFVEVAPVDGQDGGEPGGNIRCAYLYRPDAVELYRPNPGGSNDENQVIDGPAVKYNPGRIGQSDANFEATRKPLVAMWKPVKGPNKPFFTINVHFSSKGGSTGLHGDARPPVNKGVEKRTGQMELTAVS